MKWRVLLYAMLGILVIYAALIPLKLKGMLYPDHGWFVVFVGPAALAALFPALFFWHGRRKDA